MGFLFNKYNQRSYSREEIIIPERFPAIYLSDRDEVFCYTGFLFENESREPHLKNNSINVIGKHPTDKTISKDISGVYRIQSGCIVIDDYLSSYKKESTYKLVDRVLILPVSASTYYSVMEYGKTEEDKELTRSVFGLTYDELKELLSGYAKVLGFDNGYLQYPRLTRSNRADNFCDLTDLWIPKQFPYITFEESSNLYGHISLWGFYNHLGLLMNRQKNSSIYRALLKSGVSEKTLEYFFEININSLWNLDKVDRNLLYDSHLQ